MLSKILNMIRIPIGWPFVLSLLTLTQPALAQNQRVIDSLENLLKSKMGKDRWQPLYELAFEYVNNDFEHALEIIDEAYKVSLLGNDSLWIVKSLRVKAHLLGTLSRRNEQLELINRALGTASRNNYKREEALMLNNLGNLYLFSGEFDNALDIHLRALDINQERHDSSDIASSLNNLGLIYYKISNYRKAVDYFEASYRLGEAGRLSSNELVLPLLNIAISKTKMDSISEGEAAYEQARKVCTGSCYGQHEYLFSFNKAVLERRKNNLEDARANHLISLSLSRKNSVKRFELDNINALAGIAVASNNLVEAKKWLSSAALILKNEKYLVNENLNYYDAASKYYSKVGDVTKSRQYELLYEQLLNKLFSRSWTSRMIEIETAHLNKEHQKELDTERQIASLKEEVILRQKVANALMGLVVIMLLVIVYFLFISSQNRRRANLYLENCVQNRTKELLENRDQLLRMNLERAAKVNNLHSKIKQTMATLSGLCNVATNERSSEKSIEHLAEITREIKTVLSEVSATNDSEKNGGKGVPDQLSQVRNDPN
jgi:tetratricopeptide (TPR) repeat protein